jgi:hypothetical protein
MYMKEILDHVFIMMIALIIITPLSFLKFKIEGDDKNNKTILKKVLIINISIILLFTVYKFLPRYEVGIDIVINNKNTIPEIDINGKYYYMDENENKKIINIDNYGGYIGIKTENKSKIVGFINEKSIFPFNNKIKIDINNKNIKVNSFFTKIFVYTDDNEKYHDMKDFLKK